MATTTFVWPEATVAVVDGLESTIDQHEYVRVGPTRSWSSDEKCMPLLGLFVWCRASRGSQRLTCASLFDHAGASSPTSSNGPVQEPPRGRKAVPCRFYHEGRCRYASEGRGDDCAYSHILPWDEATMGALVKAGTNGNQNPNRSPAGGPSPGPNGQQNGFVPSGGPSPVGNGFPPQVNGYPGAQPNGQGPQQQIPNGYYHPNGAQDWQMYPQPTYGAPQPPQQRPPSQTNGVASSSEPSPPPSSGPTPSQHTQPQPNGYEHFYAPSYGGFPGAPANGYGMPPPPMAQFGSAPYGYYAPPLPGNPMYGGVPPPAQSQGPNGYSFQPQQPNGDGSAPNGFGGANDFSTSAAPQGQGQASPDDQQAERENQVGPPPVHPYHPYAPYPIEPPAMQMPMDPAVVEAHFSKGGHERTASLPHQAQAMYASGGLPLGPMRGARLPQNPFAGRGGRGGIFPSGGRGGRGGARPRYSTHDGSRLTTQNGTEVERPKGPRGPCSFFDLNACAFQDACLYAHVMPNGDDAREYKQGYAGPNGPVDPSIGLPVGPGRGGRMPKRQDFDPRAVAGYSIWYERMRAKERKEREAEAAAAAALAATQQGGYPGSGEDQSEIRQRLDEMVQQRRDGTIPPGGPRGGRTGGPPSRGASATGLGRGVSPSQRVPSGDDFPALEPNRVTLPTRVVEPAAFSAPAAPTSPNGQAGVDSLASSIVDLSLETAKSDGETALPTTAPVSPAPAQPARMTNGGSWASAAARALTVPPSTQNKSSSATSPRRPAREWAADGEQPSNVELPAAATVPETAA